MIPGWSLLASKQVFRELPDRRFELTLAAAMLRTGVKGSLRAFAGLTPGRRVM